MAYHNTVYYVVPLCTVHHKMHYRNMYVCIYVCMYVCIYIYHATSNILGYGLLIMVCYIRQFGLLFVLHYIVL